MVARNWFIASTCCGCMDARYPTCALSALGCAPVTTGMAGRLPTDLRWGQYPSTSSTISVPSGRINTGLMEYASHLKEYPSSTHRYPTESTLGESSMTWGLASVLSSGTLTRISYSTVMGPFAVQNVGGFGFFRICLLMSSHCALLMRSDPHPVSMSQALIMPATTGAAVFADCPPRFTTFGSVSASLFRSSPALPFNCSALISWTGTCPRCMGRPFTPVLGRSASSRDIPMAVTYCP